MNVMLYLVMNIFAPIVEKMPLVSVPDLTDSTFMDWVQLAGYMLPSDTFFQIWAILLALQVFRIVVSFFKSLWGVIPGT